MMSKKVKYSIGIAVIILIAYGLRPPDLKILEAAYSPIVNDQNGQLLSAHIAIDQQWRLPMTGPVPQRFHDAILAYEDKRYHYHIGIDPISLCRAIKQNVSQGEIVSGASTITMQLARLTYQGASRTYMQKIKEVVLALRLELWHTKAEILEWYVMAAPFGGNVVGLNTAAWRYYGKAPDQLSWAESATLATLPNAPGLIHMNRNRDALQSKRNMLLTRLYASNHIDRLTYELSISEALPDRLYELPRHAPHLLQSLELLPDDVQLRIDPDMQEVAHYNLNRYHDLWSQNDIQNAGVIIMDTRSGDILAYQGNVPQTRHESDVDMIQAKRSSGSILKPLLYAAMIDEGMITPTSIVKDVPIYIDGFSPANYNRSFMGYVPADEALQRSLNIPAVLMLQAYGITPFLEKLRDAGLTTLDKNADHYGLSLILGGGEVTLYEITRAYRSLALSANGSSSLFSPGSAYATMTALQELRRPDEEGEWRQFGANIPIAWKTGTSYGHRDAWAIGVTPEITIGIWAGNADGEGRNGIIGTKLAGTLLFSILNNLELEGSWFTPPFEHLNWKYVCDQSGDLATPSCNQVDTLLIPSNSKNFPVCRYHRKVIVDPITGLRLTSNCTDNYKSEVKSFFDIDPSAANYYKKSHPEYKPIPGISPACKTGDQLENIQIIYPSHGDRVYIPTDLNNKKQALVVEAAHHAPASKVYWYLDDNYIGTTIDWHSMAITPSKGTHNITLVDQYGEKARREFEIVGE